MGKLTEDDKKSLEDYFAEKQYDPSKDPAQATDGFAQKMMCSGGEAGYSKGGPVKMSDGGDPGMGDPNMPLSPLEQMQFNPPPAPSIGIGTTQDAPQGLAAPAAAAETPWMPGPFPPTPPPQAAGNNAQAAFNAPTGETPLGEDASPTPAAATAPAPAAPAPGKMAPDDYADLIASLKPGLGTRLAQGAFSGLGAFADAIQAGVARAGPGQNLHNINESRQNQKQNLIQALREKYETNFKGQELGINRARQQQEASHNAATEKTAQDTLAQTIANQKAEADNRAKELGIQGTKTAQEGQAQKVAAAKDTIEAYEKGSGVMGGKWGSVRPTDQEYQEALAVVKSAGGQGSAQSGKKMATPQGHQYSVTP